MNKKAYLTKSITSFFIEIFEPNYLPNNEYDIYIYINISFCCTIGKSELSERVIRKLKTELYYEE
jgi:hypothetical protein